MFVRLKKILSVRVDMSDSVFMHADVFVCKDNADICKSVCGVECMNSWISFLNVLILEPLVISLETGR